MHSSYRGWRDQYHIHYGTRLLSAAGIEHAHEEFDDNHSDIDYPTDISLPFPLPEAKGLAKCG